MFCQKCGQKNEDSAKFCSSCGNSLNTEIEKSAEQKAEEIKQKSKESASTLFYLLKPLVKVKVIIPSIIILLLVIFWSDMKNTYEDYQYKKKELVKEKKETFSDVSTGLMWQDDSFDRKRSWSGAKSFCSSLEYAGYNDWRLPDINELESIIDKSNTPAIKNGFKNVVDIDTTPYWSSSYWSSSSAGRSDYPDTAPLAWQVWFYNGRKYKYAQFIELYVRCVRDKQ